MSNVLETQENQQPIYDDVSDAADALLKRWEDAGDQPSEQATEEATAQDDEEAKTSKSRKMRLSKKSN